MPDALLLDATALSRALVRIAHEIAERNEAGRDVVLVGVQTGGVQVRSQVTRQILMGAMFGKGAEDSLHLELITSVPGQGVPITRNNGAATARSQHAIHFGQRGHDISQIFVDLHRDRNVKRIIGGRKLIGIAAL